MTTADRAALAAALWEHAYLRDEARARGHDAYGSGDRAEARRQFAEARRRHRQVAALYERMTCDARPAARAAQARPAAKWRIRYRFDDGSTEAVDLAEVLRQQMTQAAGAMSSGDAAVQGIGRDMLAELAEVAALGEGVRMQNRAKAAKPRPRKPLADEPDTLPAIARRLQQKFPGSGQKALFALLPAELGDRLGMLVELHHAGDDWRKWRITWRDSDGRVRSLSGATFQRYLGKRRAP